MMYLRDHYNIKQYVMPHVYEEEKDIITCDNCASEEIKNSGCLYTGIGTLQVPHHGSIHNFDSAILDKSNIKCAVISYGIRNTYGHPSSRVIEDLSLRSVSVHHVTEDTRSMVYS
jgi:beta-lactamase superfamily II metal-dependent hydrolase